MMFQKTNAHPGRHIAVSPENSTMKHLAYARIILNASKSLISFANGDRETGLICLSGRAVVKTDSKEVELAQYDGIYIPRDSEIEVSSTGAADLAEFSADVDGKYSLQVVRYAGTWKD